MTREQRKFLADKLAGTGNLILGGLVISQFITERPFQTWLFLSGLLGYVVLIVIGFSLLKGGGEGEPGGN